MIYITGDKHGDFSEVYAFCCKNKTTRDDLMIVLGDAGINYYANEQDIYKDKYEKVQHLFVDSFLHTLKVYLLFLH